MVHKSDYSLVVDFAAVPTPRLRQLIRAHPAPRVYTFFVALESNERNYLRWSEALSCWCSIALYGDLIMLKDPLRNKHYMDISTCTKTPQRSRHV